MTADVPVLMSKYRSKGVFLDSNLLVLLFIGLDDPALVRGFKRTRNQGFTEEEFFLLRRMIQTFSRIITTPHVLTETSNYICQLHGKTRDSVLNIIASTIQFCKERRPEAKNLVRTKAFLDFGLTDSSILDLPPKKYLVLSVDAALVIALKKKGVDAINFHNLQPIIWNS